MLYFLLNTPINHYNSSLFGPETGYRPQALFQPLFGLNLNADAEIALKLLACITQRHKTCMYALTNLNKQKSCAGSTIQCKVSTV
jgi:hypothetical protein